MALWLEATKDLLWKNGRFRNEPSLFIEGTAKCRSESLFFIFFLWIVTLFLLIFVLATFFAAFGDEQVQEVTCLYSALLTRCTRNEDTLDKLFLDRRVSKYVCFFSSPFISMTHTLLESSNSKNLVGKSITREMSHFVSIFTGEPSPRNWGPFDHRGCQFLWLLSFSPGALLLFGNCGLLHESVDEEGEGRPLVAK